MGSPRDNFSMREKMSGISGRWLDEGVLSELAAAVFSRGVGDSAEGWTGEGRLLLWEGA